MNTAIAAMMSLMNDIYEAGTLTYEELETFTLILCPFAPHLAEEMWHEVCKKTTFASLAAWPTHDEAKTKDATVEVAVQISGKFRGTISLPARSPT